MRERINKEALINIIFGVCFAFTVVYHYSLDTEFRARTILLPFFAVGGYVLAKMYQEKHEKLLKYKWLLVYAVLFAIAMVLGSAVYADNSIKGMMVPVSNMVLSFIKMVGFTGTVYMLMSVIYEKCDKLQTKSEKLSFKHKLCIGIGLFLVWFVAYLAFYPGAFSYDMRGQTSELMTHNVQRANPPLHTYYWGLCLWIYKCTGLEAIVIYSISQMLLMAWACTEVTAFLFERYRNKILLVGTLLFFANPVVAAMSFICTKDVVFGIFLILLLVSLIRREKYDNVKCVVFGLLCCLLRNNALYAAAVALIIILCIPAKVYAEKKKAIKYILILFALYLCVDKGIYNLIGVGPGWPQEKLPVPIQQIASVMYYEPDSISEEEKAAIDLFFPEEGYSSYNPRFADRVKGHFDAEAYLDNSGLFWSTWLKVGITHPDNYINSFLTLNIPYWYPDASPRDEYSDRHYIESMVRENDYYNFERKGWLPGYYEFLLKFTEYDGIAGVPLVSLSYSIALPIWLLLAMMAFALERKQVNIVVIFLPLVLFWATYLVGPVSNFRYIFPLYVAYPIIVGIMCLEKTKVEENNQV